MLRNCNVNNITDSNFLQMRSNLLIKFNCSNVEHHKTNASNKSITYSKHCARKEAFFKNILIQVFDLTFYYRKK